MADTRKKGKDINCKVCNVLFYAPRNQLKVGRKYCSVICRDADPDYVVVRNISCFHKGLIPKNKGVPASPELRERYRNAQRGKHDNPWNKGKTNIYSQETLRKIREARAKQVGNKHPSWKGGITPEQHLARGQWPFKAWRNIVFERDNYTCQECGQKGGELHAHHIIRFTDSVEKRYSTTNGITLCASCHRKTIGKEAQFQYAYQQLVTPSHVYGY